MTKGWGGQRSDLWFRCTRSGIGHSRTVGSDGVIGVFWLNLGQELHPLLVKSMWEAAGHTT